jgi:hypothetical protein
MLSQVCPCLLVPINLQERTVRDRYIEYERSEIIGRTSIDKKDAEKARKWNRRIDDELERRRKEWTFVPPSNMTIILHQDAGAFPSGVSLSVNHEIGRVLLHRRAAHIVERDDFSIDAVIDGSLEDAFDAMQTETTGVQHG